MCSDARLDAPLGLPRDLVFPGNSKIRPRLTNLHSVRLLYLENISEPSCKEDSGGLAQHGSRMKRVEVHRGRDGIRSGDVRANKGIKERAGMGRRERGRKKRGETKRRKCMNGKSEERGAFYCY